MFLLILQQTVLKQDENLISENLLFISIHIYKFYKSININLLLLFDLLKYLILNSLILIFNLFCL